MDCSACNVIPHVDLAFGPGTGLYLFQIFGPINWEKQFSLASLLHWPELKPHDWQQGQAVFRWSLAGLFNRQWSAITLCFGCLLLW